MPTHYQVTVWKDQIRKHRLTHTQTSEPKKVTYISSLPSLFDNKCQKSVLCLRTNSVASLIILARSEKVSHQQQTNSVFV